MSLNLTLYAAYIIEHKIYKTTSKMITDNSRVVQWERAGPITQRSMDRNHPLLIFFSLNLPLNFLLIHFGALFFLRLLSWCYKIDNKRNKFVKVGFVNKLEDSRF